MPLFTEHAPRASSERALLLRHARRSGMRRMWLVCGHADLRRAGLWPSVSSSPPSRPPRRRCCRASAAPSSARTTPTETSASPAVPIARVVRESPPRLRRCRASVRRASSPRLWRSPTPCASPVGWSAASFALLAW